MRPRALIMLASCCLLILQTAARGEEEKTKAVTYPVADLMTATSEINVSLGAGSAKAEKKEHPNDNAEKLIELITSAIHPESWSSLGGQGSIRHFPLGMALVVEQTPEIQEEIADLLAALRRLNELEVALDVRLVTVPQTLFERLGLNLNPVDQTSGVAFLNERSAAQILEQVQGDCRTKVVQAPRVTGINGQKVNLDFTETRLFCTDVQKIATTFVPFQKPYKLGYQVKAQPVVSADRRFVRLALSLTHTGLAARTPLIPVQIPIPPEGGKGESKIFLTFLQQPQFNVQNMETTLSIPDGGTAVVCGLLMVAEEDTQAEEPVLSKIPYLSRSFQNTGKKRECTLVMITPRVKVNEEKEEIFLRAIPPVPREPEALPQAVPAPTVIENVRQVSWESTPAPPPAPTAPVCCTALSCQATLVRDLLRAYDDACAAGRSDDAKRLGRAALVLDPACFQKRR